MSPVPGCNGKNQINHDFTTLVEMDEGPRLRVCDYCGVIEILLKTGDVRYFVPEATLNQRRL